MKESNYSSEYGVMIVDIICCPQCSTSLGQNIAFLFSSVTSPPTIIPPKYLTPIYFSILYFPLNNYLSDVLFFPA